MTINMLYLTAIVLIILAAKCGTVESQTPTEAGAVGSTPSYPETEYTSPKQEVFHKRKGWTELSTKPIQKTGTRFALRGSVFVNEYNANLAGDESTILKCSRKPVTDYKNEYQPIVFAIRQDVENGKVVNNYWEQIMDLQQSFIYLTMEVWLCKNEIQPEKTTVTRVVNEMIGKPGIFISQVDYGDGINVISRKMGDFKTILIREIKYFIPGKKGPINVPYVGRSVFPLAELDGDGVNLLAYREMSRKPDQEGNFKEINFNLDMDKVNEPIAEKIFETEMVSTLRLGSKSDGVIGDSTSLATCFREQAVYAFPHEFRTEIFQDVKFGKSKAKVSAKVTEKDYYYKYVLPIEEEIWNCKLEDDKIFLRIMNRGHIMKEAKYICKESIVFLSNFKLPNGEQRPLFREIKYIDPKTGAVVRYDGSLKLMVKKGLADLGSRDYEYLLDWNRVYRTLLDVSGFDIQIGSRYVKTIGTVNDVVNCDLFTDIDSVFNRKALNTQFRLKINKNGKLHSLKRIFSTVAGTYYYTAVRSVLNCSSGTGDFNFLRVTNEIIPRIPVRELELFDGIFVFEGEKEGRIMEIKYLDPEDFTAVKYEGQMKIRTAQLVSCPMTVMRNNELKLTNDEVNLLVGHLSVEDSTWKGISYSSSNDRIVRIGEVSSTEPNRIQYCTDPTQRVGNAEDIAECELISSEDQPQKINGRFNQFDDYFKPEKRITWNCTIPSTGIQFHKVLHRDSLRQVKVISKTEISYCSGGSVWFEMKKDNPQCYLQEITYLQKKENDFVKIKYEGKLAHKHQEESEDTSPWMSGTVIPAEVSENKYRSYDYCLPEIEHELDVRKLFLTSFKQHSKVSLIIDRKWDYSIGDENTLVTCSNNVPHDAIPYPLFQTFLSTRVKIVGDDRLTSYAVLDSFFMQLGSKIWLCSNWWSYLNIGLYFNIGLFFTLEPPLMEMKVHPKMQASDHKLCHFQLVKVGKNQLVDSDDKPINFYRIVIHNAIKPEAFEKIKEIHHSSGITVLMGEERDEHQQEIVELIYVDQNMIPIKFEGRVELADFDSNSGSKVRMAGRFHENVHALRLWFEVRKEINYLLPPDQVFRRDLEETGYILEVGRPYAEVIGSRKAKYNCRETKAVDLEEKFRVEGGGLHEAKNLKPFVMVYNYREDGTTELLPMDDRKLKDTFTVKQGTWFCYVQHYGVEDTDDEYHRYKFFWRVERFLFLKTPKSLSRIYHYDGVTVEHNSTGHVMIRELSYLSLARDGESHRVLRFKGFLRLEEKNGAAKKMEEINEADKEWRMDLGREFLHIEDTPRINVRRFKEPGDGLILELHSPFQEKIKNNLIRPLVLDRGALRKRLAIVCDLPGGNQVMVPDDRLPELVWKSSNSRSPTNEISYLERFRCQRLEEKQYRAYVKELGIQFSGSKNADGTKRDWIDFMTIKQDVYNCSDEKENHFMKIYNVVITDRNIASFYFGDGISLSKIELPDGKEATVISETKFMTADFKKLLKYEGEVTSFKRLSNDLATLFQIPNRFESFPTMVDDEKTRRGQSTQKSAWPLEILRFIALKYKANRIEKVKIEYTGVTQRKVIDRDSKASLHFGSRWEKEIANENNDEMRCILDEWNPTTHFKFIARVILFIGDHQYFLDDETVEEYFTIDRIEVWICVNKEDTIIRVVTKLEGVKEIYGISYNDGNEVEPITLPSGRKAVNVTETLYIDAKDFKLVKYEPELTLLKWVTPPTPKPTFQKKLRQLGGDMEKKVVKSWKKVKSLVKKPLIGNFFSKKSEENDGLGPRH